MNKKRKQVKKACFCCRKAHTACSDCRPCIRCYRLSKPCWDDSISLDEKVVKKFRGGDFLKFLPRKGNQKFPLVKKKGRVICSLEDIEGTKSQYYLSRGF